MDSTLEAAEAYSPTRGFPGSDKIYRLELEIAFISGAQWYNQARERELERRLAELQEEAANAR